MSSNRSQNIKTLVQYVSKKLHELGWDCEVRRITADAASPEAFIDATLTEVDVRYKESLKSEKSPNSKRPLIVLSSSESVIRSNSHCGQGLTFQRWSDIGVVAFSPNRRSLNIGHEHPINIGRSLVLSIEKECMQADAQECLVCMEQLQTDMSSTCTGCSNGLCVRCLATLGATEDGRFPCPACKFPHHFELIACEMRKITTTSWNSLSDALSAVVKRLHAKDGRTKRQAYFMGRYGNFWPVELELDDNLKQVINYASKHIRASFDAPDGDMIALCSSIRPSPVHDKTGAHIHCVLIGEPTRLEGNSLIVDGEGAMLFRRKKKVDEIKNMYMPYSVLASRSTGHVPDVFGVYEKVKRVDDPTRLEQLHMGCALMNLAIKWRHRSEK